jgi:hypothetical protein
MTSTSAASPPAVRVHGQRYASARSVKQLDAKPLLQPPDRLAESWLRDADSFCSPAKVHGLRQRNKMSEMLHLNHKQSLS